MLDNPELDSCIAEADALYKQGEERRSCIPINYLFGYHRHFVLDVTCDRQVAKVSPQEFKAKGQLEAAYVCDSFCFKVFSRCKLSFHDASEDQMRCTKQLSAPNNLSIWQHSLVFNFGRNIACCGLGQLNSMNKKKPGQGVQDSKPCLQNDIIWPQGRLLVLQELDFWKSIWMAA